MYTSLSESNTLLMGKGIRLIELLRVLLGGHQNRFEWPVGLCQIVLHKLMAPLIRTKRLLLQCFIGIDNTGKTFQFLQAFSTAESAENIRFLLRVLEDNYFYD